MYQITNSLSRVLSVDKTYTGLVMTFISRRYVVSNRNNSLEQYYMVSNVYFRITTGDNTVINRIYIFYSHNLNRGRLTCLK